MCGLYALWSVPWRPISTTSTPSCGERSSMLPCSVVAVVFFLSYVSPCHGCLSVHLCCRRRLVVLLADTAESSLATCLRYLPFSCNATRQAVVAHPHRYAHPCSRQHIRTRRTIGQAPTVLLSGGFPSWHVWCSPVWWSILFYLVAAGC